MFLMHAQTIFIWVETLFGKIIVRFLLALTKEENMLSVSVNDEPCTVTLCLSLPEFHCMTLILSICLSKNGAFSPI